MPSAVAPFPAPAGQTFSERFFCISNAMTQKFVSDFFSAINLQVTVFAKNEWSWKGLRVHHVSKVHTSVLAYQVRQVRMHATKKD